MRVDKYFGVCLAVVFFSSGGYLLHDAVYHAGPHADGLILIGAILSALAVVALSWSLKLHSLTKAMQRHMRGQ